MTNETDIVERLEAMAGVETSALFSQRKTLNEAAALIRSLRAANAALVDTAQNYADAFDKLSNDRWVKDGAYEISNGQLRAEVASLRAENDRLREDTTNDHE